MAGSMSIAVKGADRVAAGLTKAGAEADAKAYAVTRTYTHLLAARVRTHASGRPGPNTPTGDYRRSITGEVERRGGGMSIGTVGTSRPQGRRLEFGFVGVDALGRHYRQPPFPHFRPALAEIEWEYMLAVRGVIR